MQLLINIFGEGKDLTITQMTCRGVLIFFITLLLIRIAGRRTFGIRTAFDNIIGILLGAILSRAVVGVSPFAATVLCSLSIVLLHRIMAMTGVYNSFFEKMIKGEKVLLYKDGAFIPKHMKRALVSEKDVEEALRIATQLNVLDEVKEAYMENNGEISIVLKEKK
jgi:uncharacterized membrane protein YcaP (DUF421 family)